MMYLDYFFLFLGVNGASTPQGKQNDENHYLFLMKEMQVKSEFKIHGNVVFLDKNQHYKLLSSTVIQEYHKKLVQHAIEQEAKK